MRSVKCCKFNAIKYLEIAENSLPSDIIGPFHSAERCERYQNAIILLRKPQQGINEEYFKKAHIKLLIGFQEFLDFRVIHE